MRRVALITGGSRGIGAACVRLFAEKGCAVVFLYRSREDAANALVEELRARGLDAAGYRCDVADGEQVKAGITAVLPGMISRKQGSIVNMASMWGETGASCEVAYSAAKAAVIGFTKALAKEVGPSGVRVNCVSPGLIDTDMNAELDGAALDELADETPLGRIGSAAEVAEAVLFLSEEGASFVTGQVLGVSGGLQI